MCSVVNSPIFLSTCCSTLYFSLSTNTLCACIHFCLQPWFSSKLLYLAWSRSSLALPLVLIVERPTQDPCTLFQHRLLCRTTTCRFSGLRIYPGRGIIFVRTDGQVLLCKIAIRQQLAVQKPSVQACTVDSDLFLQQFLFINKKARRLYHQRKRPAKIAWTTVYRKQHRKVSTRQDFVKCCT